jgi:hypothetical protein
MYLPFCRVLNFMKGGYILPVNISKREFDSELAAIARTQGLSTDLQSRRQ